MQDTHSALEMEQTLQDNCVFTHIYSTQEEGWHPVKEAITTHTNSFSEQWEQKGMISPSKRMIITSLLHQPDTEDLVGGIIREEDQIEINNNTPLINDLEMSDIFKNEDDEKRNSVIDKLIMEVSWLLKLVAIVAGCIVEDAIE